jgi:SAM-dependent methyltransferase
MKCRHCTSSQLHDFLDLGYAPPSNAYLEHADLNRPETYFPLRLKVCTDCWLVQTEDYAAANALFADTYAYFSSTSTSWMDHARRYAEKIRADLALGANSFVVEVASNDGYLLRHFVAAGIPCLGIEPTASTADAAAALGIPVLREFFGHALGASLAARRGRADLIIGNNVYAHVPDIADFTAGLKELLAPGGTITLEFPHLLRLIEQVQFDTVYHEHFSYLSLGTVTRIFAGAGLRVLDVEELSTHGGSLRVYGCHADDPRQSSVAVESMLRTEVERGLQSLARYQVFQHEAERRKDDLLLFLLEARRAGKSVAGYGAAAKGNTLLNFAGVKPDLLPFVCDAAPAKQGRYLPGSHIPIQTPAYLEQHRPDFILILPWNIGSEVRQQLAGLARLGSRFVTAIPTLNIE